MPPIRIADKHCDRRSGSNEHALHLLLRLFLSWLLPL